MDSLDNIKFRLNVKVESSQGASSEHSLGFSHISDMIEYVDRNIYGVDVSHMELAKGGAFTVEQDIECMNVHLGTVSLDIRIPKQFVDKQ